MLQEGCEFLVAQTPDGRMDLRDVYVLDQDGGMYARPVTTGEMPPEPQLFVAVPWRQEFLGDLSHNKDPWTKVRLFETINVIQAIGGGRYLPSCLKIPDLVR